MSWVLYYIKQTKASRKILIEINGRVKCKEEPPRLLFIRYWPIAAIEMDNTLILQGLFPKNDMFGRSIRTMNVYCFFYLLNAISSL
jgi:hypothetical protein